MTLEEKAEEYAINMWGDDEAFIDERNNCKQDYIAGARENGIFYHDLRENPNDLPEDTYDVLDQAGYKIHYNFFQNVWVNEKDEIDNHVIAWCEVPQFKG